MKLTPGNTYPFQTRAFNALLLCSEKIHTKQISKDPPKSVVGLFLCITCTTVDVFHTCQEESGTADLRFEMLFLVFGPKNCFQHVGV